MFVSASCWLPLLRHEAPLESQQQLKTATALSQRLPAAFDRGAKTLVSRASWPAQVESDKYYLLEASWEGGQSRRRTAAYQPAPVPWPQLLFSVGFGAKSSTLAPFGELEGGTKRPRLVQARVSALLSAP